MLRRHKQKNFFIPINPDEPNNGYIIINDKNKNIFPVILNLTQYNNDIFYSNNTLNQNGDIGNNYMRYSIDCKHKCLNINSENDSFKFILTSLLNRRAADIRRDFLIEKFYIIEIPDYSNQSMSAFYRDFVIQIFKENGKKVLQKDIGIIKCYNTKKAYILIDKTTETEITSDNIKNIRIKVLFKNNIEDGLKSIKLVYNTETGLYTYTNNNNTDFIFSGNIDDYDIYFKQSSTSEIIKINNDKNDKYIEFDTNDYKENNENFFIDIKRQTGNNSIKDYFFQSNKVDLTEFVNRQEFYNRDIRDKFSLSLKLNNEYSKDGSSVILYTKQNLKDFYFVKELNGDTGYTINIDAGLITSSMLNHYEQLNIYADGVKLIPGIDYNLSSGVVTFIKTANKTFNNIEIIPEYNNVRKIDKIFSIEGNIANKNTVLNKILKDSLIYRWNISFSADDTDFLLFKDGLLKSINDIVVGTSIYELQLWDYGGSKDFSNIPEEIEEYETLLTSYTDNTELRITFNDITCNTITNDDYTIFTDPYLINHGSLDNYKADTLESEFILNKQEYELPLTENEPFFTVEDDNGNIFFNIMGASKEVRDVEKLYGKNGYISQIDSKKGSILSALKSSINANANLEKNLDSAKQHIFSMFPAPDDNYFTNSEITFNSNNVLAIYAIGNVNFNDSETALFETRKNNETVYLEYSVPVVMSNNKNYFIIIPYFKNSLDSMKSVTYTEDTENNVYSIRCINSNDMKFYIVKDEEGDSNV